MSKKPILQKELEKADGITGAQINFLCDRFEVSKLDLADACGHTLSTYYTYMNNNAEKMPQETQEKTIAFFLDLFRKESQGYVKKKEPSAASEQPSEEIPGEDSEYQLISAEMMQNEAIRHIKDTPIEELWDFIPDDEERTGVLEAWEEKLKEYDPLITSEQPAEDPEDEERCICGNILESSKEKFNDTCSECEPARAKKKGEPQPEKSEKPFGEDGEDKEESDIYDAVHEFRKENGFYDREKNQNPESSPYPHIDQRFDHLSFVAITFRPKNGNLADALEEAATYSIEARCPVHVVDKGLKYKIECVGE